MPYYPTLREDVERAKEILAEGRVEPPDLPLPEHVAFSGTIHGKDTYAAYKLLESFVETLEALDVRVCETALRARRLDTPETVAEKARTARRAFDALRAGDIE